MVKSRTSWAALAAFLATLAASGGAAADLPQLPDLDRIGLGIQSMTPELRRHFGAPEDRGLLVTRVVPGQPAAKAGVAVGDVILEAGGEPQRGSYDLVRGVGRAEAGRPLPLVILRDGKRRTLSVVPTGPSAPWPDPDAFTDWLERAIQQGSDELREQLRRMEKRLEELEQELERERERRDGAERTSS